MGKSYHWQEAVSTEYTRQEIDSYLIEMKRLVSEGEFEIVLSDDRPDNMDLFDRYLINENRAKGILLDLTPEDFSEAIQADDPLYCGNYLYVFGKQVLLLERYGHQDVWVNLYIKTLLLETDKYVLVISFHAQKFPVKLYFV